MPTFRVSLQCAFAAILAGSGVPSIAQRAALVQNVDEPARAPFSVQTTGPYVEVPPGQRWVVEVFTATCNSAGNAMTGLQVDTHVGVMAPAITYAPGQYLYTQSGVKTYFATGHGPLYADAKSGVFFTAFTALGHSSELTCRFNISGHAIPMPT